MGVRILGSEEWLSPPLPFRLLARFPLLRRIPARLVGLGSNGVRLDFLPFSGTFLPWHANPAFTVLEPSTTSYCAAMPEIELGSALNRDISPLGRVGRRLQREASQDSRLRELVAKVREKLQE